MQSQSSVTNKQTKAIQYQVNVNVPCGVAVVVDPSVTSTIPQTSKASYTVTTDFRLHNSSHETSAVKLNKDNQ